MRDMFDFNSLSRGFFFQICAKNYKNFEVTLELFPIKGSGFGVEYLSFRREMNEDVDKNKHYDDFFDEPE
jgi:hypothetical protein